MKILVLNCGSSSIKYQLLDMANDADILAKGIVERIGMANSEIKHQAKDKEKQKMLHAVPDHQVGVDLILQVLKDKNYGIIESENEIGAVGHRVVHGGEKFSGSVLITQEVIDKMEECVDLAPLHNPANLKGVYAMQKLLPEVPQCGVFDTAFHATMPEHVYMYPIAYEMYEKYKIRRYGFHGASHRYVSLKVCEMLKRDYKTQKIITCHLGNGASVAAIKNGASFDTSMGLTPVEGLMMGTRCGDFDLGALFYIMYKEGYDLNAANNFVNKKCGVLGISGVSSDMRDLWDAADEGHERAKLALDMYIYRVKKYVGAYAAAMGGVDIIVFAGGVGENDYLVREGVCKDMEFFGIEGFDAEFNYGLKSQDVVLTKPGSKTTVVTLTTNEELVIAQDTLMICNGSQS